MKAVHAMRMKSDELVLLTAFGISAPLPSRTRHDVQGVLARTLLDSARRKATLQELPGPPESRFEIVRDPWGKPNLIFETGAILSISYSRGAGRLWAALACGEFSVGVDVSDFAGFGVKYPFSRTFCEREWSWAASQMGGDRASAAALLWAAKEATVKALGCGFHLIDPLWLEVEPLDEIATTAWTTHCVAIHYPGFPPSLELAARALENSWCCVATVALAPGSGPPGMAPPASVRTDHE
jgi:hypothetical protein